MTRAYKVEENRKKRNEINIFLEYVKTSVGIMTHLWEKRNLQHWCLEKKGIKKRAGWPTEAQESSVWKHKTEWKWKEYMGFNSANQSTDTLLPTAILILQDTKMYCLKNTKTKEYHPGLNASWKGGSSSASRMAKARLENPGLQPQEETRGFLSRGTDQPQRQAICEFPSDKTAFLLSGKAD